MSALVTASSGKLAFNSITARFLLRVKSPSTRCTFVKISANYEFIADRGAFSRFLATFRFPGEKRCYEIEVSVMQSKPASLDRVVKDGNLFIFHVCIHKQRTSGALYIIKHNFRRWRIVCQLWKEAARRENVYCIHEGED